MARQFLDGQRFFRESSASSARGVAPRLVRLLRPRFRSSSRLGGCDGSSPRRSRGTGRTGSRTTPFGGRASTAPKSSRTSRRPTPTTRTSSAVDLAQAERQFAEKGAHESLLPFGWGDGGGGPTREMMERPARLRDLEGSPRVEIGSPSTPSSTRPREYPDAPVWIGRDVPRDAPRHLHVPGAHQAGQPPSERLLREAELWAATAFGGVGAAYPVDSSTAVADGAPAAVPRHPPRLVDRLGPPRGPRPPSPACSRPSSRASIAPKR